MSTLSGFNWPTGSARSPNTSESDVSQFSSATPSSRALKTSAPMSHTLTATSGSGAPPVSILPIAPSHAVITSGSSAPPVSATIALPSSTTETLGTRTSRVVITQTVTVIAMQAAASHTCTGSRMHEPGTMTPTASPSVPTMSMPRAAYHSDDKPLPPATPTTVRPAAVSGNNVAHRMSEVHVAHAVGRTRAAEVTGVSFKIYDSSAGRNADQPDTASNKAIIGAIIGTVCFIVLAVLFCAVRRKRFKYGSKGKRSTAEKGLHQVNGRRRTTGRSTNDAIDDAYRARLERNQWTREAQKTAARQASTADDQGPVTAGCRREASSASTLGSIDSSALAQAQGGNAPFAADTFQSHQPPPSLTSMPDVLHPPPIIIEPPTPARHGSQQVDVRCVSPLRETFGMIREPGMGTVGYDVSPPDSPKESGGDRWAR